MNLKGLNLVFFKTLRTKGDEIPDTGYDMLLHSMYFVSRGGGGHNHRRDGMFQRKIHLVHV